MLQPTICNYCEYSDIEDYSSAIRRQDEEFKVERLTLPDGRYYTDGKRKWRSVNEITRHHEATAWRDFKRAPDADEKLKAAAERGTAIHANVEKFFLSGDHSALSPQMYRWAEKVTPLLVEHMIFWESEVWGKPIGFGGTLDSVVTMDGDMLTTVMGQQLWTGYENILIDIKTKGKIGKLEWMKNHYTQLAAYRLGLRREGLKINRAMIVCEVSGQNNLDFIYLGKDALDHYERLFVYLMYHYYHSPEPLEWKPLVSKAVLPERVNFYPEGLLDF
jgi:hypothetical protein